MRRGKILSLKPIRHFLGPAAVYLPQPAIKTDREGQPQIPCLNLATSVLRAANSSIVGLLTYPSRSPLSYPVVQPTTISIWIVSTRHIRASGRVAPNAASILRGIPDENK